MKSGLISAWCVDRDEVFGWNIQGWCIEDGKFSHSDSARIAGKQLRACAWQGMGGFGFGTTNGVGRMSQGKFRSYSADGGLRRIGESVEEDRDGAIGWQQEKGE